MNKRRLLKLADLLEADAKNKKGVCFDLNVVAAKIVSKGEYRNHAVKDVPTVDCRTAACAVGLACISGAFKRQGLTYRINRDWGLDPKFGRRVGFDKVPTAFFEITEDQSDFLFMPESYEGATTGATGERKVATRIRDFVAGRATVKDAE
jgi:hypothetical protein